MSRETKEELGGLARLEEGELLIGGGYLRCVEQPVMEMVSFGNYRKPVEWQYPGLRFRWIVLTTRRLAWFQRDVRSEVPLFRIRDCYPDERSFKAPYRFGYHATRSMILELDDGTIQVAPIKGGYGATALWNTVVPVALYRRRRESAGEG